MTAHHRFTPTPAGVGLRLPHLAEVVATQPAVSWFEIHPENFLANPHASELLTELARSYPISVHSVGVSIGSAGGVDRTQSQARPRADRADRSVSGVRPSRLVDA